MNLPISAHHFLAGLAAGALLALPLPGQAAPEVAPAKAVRSAPAPLTEQVMEARLKALYPRQKFDAVRPSPMPGFWEVTMGQSIAYVENSGRYFLFGGLWDMQAKRDLSAERRAELDRVDLSKLPLDNAIVYGEGAKTVHVFADPNCGYCKQLEQTLSQVQGLRVVLHPTPILGEASVETVQRIWCAPDRVAAWKDWMLKGIQPPAVSGDCQAPLDAFTKLASQHKVAGTPMLVSQDGRKLSGALPLAQLVAWLGAAETTGAAAAASPTSAGAGSAPSPKTAARAGAQGATPIVGATASAQAARPAPQQP